MRKGRLRTKKKQRQGSREAVGGDLMQVEGKRVGFAVVSCSDLDSHVHV